jgi:WD40 repeat protein
MLAVAAGGHVKLRNIRTGEESAITLPRNFRVGSLAISRDGTKLAIGSSSDIGAATVRIYDTRTLQTLRTFRDGPDAANAIVFSPDGKQLFVGGGNSSVSIWDIDSPGEPEILAANGTVFLDLSRDGKMLAAGSINQQTNTFPVLLWDLSVKEKRSKELLGHGAKVTSVAFSPDGDMLATGSMDRTVRLWDPRTGYPIRVLSLASRVFCVAFSRRGHYLAIGLEDGSIKLYDAIENLDGPTLIGHHHPVTSLSFGAGRVLFSSDNKRLSQPDDPELLFEESSKTTVKEWDVNALTREQTPFRFTQETRSIRDLAYSADGKILVAPAFENTTFLDAETNKPIEMAGEQKLRIVSAAFSPDNKRMASIELDRNNRTVIVVRSLPDLKPVAESIDGKGVLYLAFSPSGKLLVTCTADSDVEVWDAGSSKLVSAWRPDGILTAIAFHADDKVITLHNTGQVNVWNVNSQKSLTEFQLSRKDTDATADSYAVSPDGRYFAASYPSGTAVLYNGKGTPIATFKSQAEGFPVLAFSSNGRLLATGGVDGMVKLWDTTSRRELLTLRGTPYPVLSIAFSRDETKLATLDSRGYVRVWRAPVDASIAASAPLGFAQKVR